MTPEWNAFSRLVAHARTLRRDGPPQYATMLEDLGIVAAAVVRTWQGNGNAEVLAAIQQLKKDMTSMTTETDAAVAALTDQIAAVKAGTDTAVTMLNQLPALLAASGVPPATVQALTASLKAGFQPLLDAIVADGPAPAPPGPIIVTPPPPPAPAP